MSIHYVLSNSWLSHDNELQIQSVYHGNMSTNNRSNILCQIINQPSLTNHVCRKFNKVRSDTLACAYVYEK